MSTQNRDATASDLEIVRHLSSTGRSYDDPIKVGELGAIVNHTVKRAATEAAMYITSQVKHQDAARQMVEDERANHRNLNRMLTLIGALLIGLALTYLFTHPAIMMSVGFSAAFVKAVEPYTFVITIFMDSSLAAYSFFKKY